MQEKVQGSQGELFPLSSSQMNIWNLEQAFGSTPMNNICETIRIRGTFDISAISRCLNLVLESDPSLRIQITVDASGIPMQYELPYEKTNFTVLDFSMTNEEGLVRWEESITREVMPVVERPLYQFVIIRIGEHEGEILVKTHHLISDGWSQVALINKIAVTYLDLISGSDVSLEVAPSYRLHVEDEQKYSTSRMYEKDKRYWNEILEDVGQPVSLKEYSNVDISPVGHRKTFYLSEVLNHSLTSFCAHHRVAPFAVFYMAIAIYLKRTRGVERFCMGAPVHNRATHIDRQTTGMFVSTLPFLTELDENWSFEDFNGYLTDEWLELLRHQKLPFADIFAIAKAKNPELERLYHLVLSFHNSQAYKNHDTSVSFSGQWHYSGYQAEHICIHLNNIEDEKRYSVNYDYLTQLFSETEIESFHNFIVNILTQALSWPQRPIKDMSFLGIQEEEKVLFDFNRTEKYVPEKTLARCIKDVCEKYPTRVAVIERGRRFTYETMYADSQLLAGQIIEKSLKNSYVAAIMQPRSYSLMVSMIAAINAGMAWVIIPENAPKQRVAEILSDCEPDIVLTNHKMEANLRSFTLPIVCVEDVISHDHRSATAMINNRDLFDARMEATLNDSKYLHELAYMIYTSGSTGKPKGVEVEQYSLLNFANNMRDYYSTGAVLSICNPTFDAYLIESIVPLLNGQTIVVADDNDCENPLTLASLIRDYAVGFMSITPSRLAAYMKNAVFCKALVRLEAVLCGGENYPSSLLNQLSKYTGARIYNQYGPTETTVGVTIAQLNQTAYMSVGRPMGNCRCYILDKYKNPLPVGVYGDLYIAGICVARGYHNDADLTAAAFTANPFEMGERMYRSGDIACWTADGQIIIKGRSDSQVKLRGQRFELGEVSAKIMSHPLISMAAARLVKQNDISYLALYYTSSYKVTESELLEYCVTMLPDYMIPSVFICVADIPLTSNGKVDINALPMPAENAVTGDGLAAAGSAAERIAAVFAKVLGRADIPVHGDYFVYGGDSLNAMETLTTLEEEFGIRLKVADLYACRSAARLAVRIGDDKESEAYAVRPTLIKAPMREHYPLTKTQMGIYYEMLLRPQSLTYNMPCAFRVETKVDRLRLEQAYAQLLQTEPMLRVGIVQTEDGIAQKVYHRVSAPVMDLSGMSLDEARAAFVAPFDITCPPLIRFALWTDENSSVVFMDMHHIIGDGETAALLLDRLNRAYMGEELKGTPLSYMDYAWWRHEHGAELENEQHPWWESAMKDIPALMDIPTDFERKMTDGEIAGEVVEYALSVAQTHMCDSFCEKTGVTPYMLFGAAFGLMFSKVSGDEDFFVGVPMSIRHLRETENMAGMFVNTLPLRMMPAKDISVGEYLEQVRNGVVGLVDHAQMPLDAIAKMAGLGAGQTMLYNLMVSMRPVQVDKTLFDNHPVVNVPLDTHTAKLDYNLEIYREHDCWKFRLEYASEMYREITAQFYARAIGHTAVELTKDSNRLLKDVNCVHPADSFALYAQTENLSAAYPDIPLDRMVDMAAMMAPDSPALIFHDQTMTLGELKTYSDALAVRLQRAGVKQRDCVGILSRRGPQLIIAMMAVLKLGCAYVPMLPSFPGNRLNYMMDISNVTLTLCDSDTYKTLSDELHGSFLDIGAAKENVWEDAAVFEPVMGRNSDDVCFVLFTSGSTGQPKGVMIRHQSISNLYAMMQTKLAPAKGGFLCTANSIFDIFITETLITMAMGNYTVMADEDEMVLPWKCADLIKRHNVRIVEFTPSRASLFVEHKEFLDTLNGMPIVFMCGEVFPLPLLEALRKAGCKQIFNLYGPTEVTVYCTMDDVTTTDKITVGRIYPNCRAYVMDENRNKVMPTARGEMYFGGACVSAGYVGRPDLTDELYVDDPYQPGQKLYRSGDIVRLLPDGCFDFVGRADHQVKLNGQRVELAEINRKILNSGMVEQAAVVVVADGDFKALKGFVTKKAGDDRLNDLTQLRRYLEQELPGYMVPSSIIVLDAMPMTPSGKTDLKALETMSAGNVSVPKKVSVETPKVQHVQVEAITEEKAEEGTDQKISSESDEFTPEVMRSMWKASLSVDEIEENVSFFEQGGTSLLALNLLSRYYNRGLSMTLAEFYGNPTFSGHCAHFFKDTSTGTDNVKVPTENVQEVSVSQTVHELPEKIVNDEKNAVFMTGATGFFGVHMLKELLDHGYDEIYCLLRGHDVERLLDTVTWYFGRGYASSVRKKIHPVPGDLCDMHFGIEPSVWSMLTQKVGMVIHAAADVRHYASDDSAFITNREGTRHALELAKASNARFVQISTVSLGAEHIIAEPNKECSFTEDDFEIGQNWMENIYLKGKFESERLVREAAGEGLNVMILRIGRLVGRESDGVFQKNPATNAFWGLVNGFVQMGSISKELGTLKMETTAVDACAHAALLLIENGTRMVYHIYNPHMKTVQQMIEDLGIDIALTDRTMFENELKNRSFGAFGVNVGITMLTTQYQRFMTSPIRIQPDCKQTQKELHALGFMWEEPDIKKLLDAFVE